MAVLCPPAPASRARWSRLETARILTRFFHCERALLLAQSAWLPEIAPFAIKTGLPRFIWQNAQTAGALRERVFELRHPNRLIEPEASLVALFERARQAPSAAAFLQVLGTVLLPAMRDAYREYLDAHDPLADGPTARFLSLALAEKEEEAAVVGCWAGETLAAAPGEREAAERWSRDLARSLAAAGGLGTEPGPGGSEGSPRTAASHIPDRPARDARFACCRFYWPDIVDPAFPYGEGASLQLRVAISHLNEVWAVETAGALLSAFADVLPWDWIADAARWTYDEARHCRMGYDRLRAWGFEPGELPLGSYIYESAAGEDPIYRLGMLFFFETKNIGHKPRRAKALHDAGDRLSELDLEFDWADETIHAEYGKRWLTEILALRGEEPGSLHRIRDRCQELVARCVGTASAEEVSAIRELADRLVARATGRRM